MLYEVITLDACVQQGTFRADLLFRLQAFSLDLPELRLRLVV